MPKSIRVFSSGWLAAVTAALVLGGCGGGGGGDPAVTPTPVQTVQFVDSFGRAVPPEAGFAGGDSGGDGTAGDGAPIVGGTVSITDTTGKNVTATTNAEGYYRAKLTGMVPPFVVKVTRADGRPLHSLNVKDLRPNAFITINISGLTDKVASDVARAGGQAGAAQLTPQVVAANSAAVTASVNSLRTQLAPVITTAGIDPNSFDPLSVPFRADHTGYDFVLDNTDTSVGPDGQTQVGIAPTFTPPGGLTGTWTLSITSPDFPPGSVAPTDVPGAAVPKDSTTAANRCDSPFTQTTSQGSVTCSGNVLTVTTPGGTQTLTTTLVSYQGCGSCGIGSSVVASYRVTVLGASGTTYALSYVLTYVRKS